jgi:hypothetical protein
VNLNRLYKAGLLLAAVVSSGSLVWGILIISTAADTPSRSPALPIFALILFFLLSSFLLRASGEPLDLPISTGAYRITLSVVATLYIATAMYGFLTWPYAPIKRAGNSYTDKVGQLHTETEFDSFKRWESALFLVGLPFALVAIARIPSNKKVKKGAA